MSAPPIGMMISTPSAKASAVIATNGVQSLSSARKNAAPRPTMTSPRTRFSQCWPGKTTGADENGRNFLPRPASLPNAITDPENVIAPTKVPMNSSSLLPLGRGSGTPKALGWSTAATAISTAARYDGDGGQHRDGHSRHAEIIAAARRGRRGQPFQRQDEADRGDQVPQRELAGAHFCFFLNICSMRCVTRKPPATFTEASATAITPSTEPKSSSAGAAARTAPTMITLEMALVRLISGVCSAGVTFQMTW